MMQAVGQIAMETLSALLERAARAVGDLTGVTCEMSSLRSTAPKDRGFDGVARLMVHGRKVRKPFVVKRSVNLDVLHLLTFLRKDSADGLLLVTSHVNERQAEILRKAGVEFMDEAGNVFLTGPGLHVLMTGRRAVRSLAAVSRPRVFHPSGLKLLFALLADPQLDNPQPNAALVSRTYRDIGATTGIPHSTIGWIMADLMRLGIVVQVEDSVRALVERSRLLERWVQGYQEDLRPKLVAERYRASRADWWKTASLQNALWSGEVAESKLTGTLKPGTVTVFGERPSHRFVLKHNLQKDPKGPVEFLSPFWRMEVASGPAHTCVHPILVYADLLAIDDDRTREAAQAVYHHHLRSIIETA